MSRLEDLSPEEREAIRRHVDAAPPMDEATIARIRLLFHDGVGSG